MCGQVVLEQVVCGEVVYEQVVCATQKAAASTASSGNQARHQSQPSATQSDGRCHQVPRLPRKVKVDVTKCHACHAKSRGVHGVIWEPSAPCHACRAKGRSMSPSPTPATQDARPCRRVPRLPRKKPWCPIWEPSAPPVPAQCHQCHTLTVDVTKSHACHAGCTARPCR